MNIDLIKFSLEELPLFAFFWFMIYIAYLVSKCAKDVSSDLVNEYASKRRVIEHRKAEKRAMREHRRVPRRNR